MSRYHLPSYGLTLSNTPQDHPGSRTATKLRIGQIHLAKRPPPKNMARTQRPKMHHFGVPIFLESSIVLIKMAVNYGLMWLTQQINNAAVISINRWHKPFPVMGGLWHCPNHITMVETHQRIRKHRGRSCRCMWGWLRYWSHRGVRSLLYSQHPAVPAINLQNLKNT